jgi:hypothetical protein
MRWGACFLFLTLAAGCVLEDKPVDGGPCGICPVDEPVCNDDLECVQCTAEDDDYCEERGRRCDTDEFVCVQCLGNSDCTAADAARCDTDTHECVECDSHAQCTGVDELPDNGNACDDGLCVDCTAGTESTTCVNYKSCNPATRQCTNTTVGSRDVCEKCIADSECGNDGAPSEAHRCVEMLYQGDPFPDDDTGFCLKTTEGGCEQPYSITLSNHASLSGPPDDSYCGINENLATCPAVRALEFNVRCDGGTNEECPQPSGLCSQVGDLDNRCTYPCASLIECLPDNPPGRPGSTCGSSGSDGDDYCGG